jgi:hypothetical protein
MQAERRPERTGNSEYERRARQTRVLADSRRPSIDVRGVVTEAPPSLQAFKSEFEASSDTADVRAMGYRIALTVCAMQPSVFTDVPVPDVDPHDFEALATVTLEQSAPLATNIEYDENLRTWSVLVPSPNLKIVREFQSDVGSRDVALGFTVRLFASFLQVVRIRDRYVLVDGCHRAFALLRKGIGVVPGLVREANPAEEFPRRHGMLPPAVTLGPRPPLLPDYLDDEVSAAVELPETRRLIIVQGLEMSVVE